MKLSRNLALKFHFLLDQCLPPILRDTKWFMSIPFKIFYKDRAHTFLTFKERAPFLSPEEFAECFRLVEPVLFERETDLNTESIEEIKKYVLGPTVLEVGCGKGLLAQTLVGAGLAPALSDELPGSGRPQGSPLRVTATDIIVDEITRSKSPDIEFKEANAEALPFPDQSFDTVICTHTLEHVQHLAQAMSGLRRVTRRRLIIVVPMQRPYKYTFDLHLNFFPYPHSFLQQINAPKNAICKNIGGDLFYVENY